MPAISNDTLEKLEPIQHQIWKTVSSTMSDAAGQDVSISDPVITSAKTAELYAELGQPMMVIQFAFSSQPESSQVILIPQETVLGLAELVTGSKVEEPDENIVAELRAPLEALVQGICLSVGTLQNDMVVATGLTIRFQIFSFPPNIQRIDRVVKTQLTISGDDLEGGLMWLMDHDAAAAILGGGFEMDEVSPFPTIGGASETSGARSHAPEEPSSLELLLDVPLEMSVELGRVKMLVRDVLDLTNGSILEIDKLAGEPVDVLVNGRIMGRGEVVVIEDNFGVRITEIINPNVKSSREAA